MTALRAPADRLHRQLRRLALLASMLLAGALLPAAQAATGAKNFDHLSTGFPLTGQHQSARCEDCHVRGIFKGTPAQCAACHTQGALVNAVMIPNNHFPTSQPCSSCHTTATFYGAHFPHSDVAVGTCSQCHNGVFAMGKTPNHIVTTASCDVCHTTVSFASSYVVYPLGHIPTAEACAVCHDSAHFVPAIGWPTAMVHTGITTDCTQCHAAAPTPLTFTIKGTMTINGSTVTITSNGLPVNVQPKPQGTGHIPTERSCELCHSGGYAASPQTFRGGVMNHDGITSGCAACHADGKSFTGVTNLVTMSTKGTHIPLPAGDDCSTCHNSVKAFGPGTAMNHAGITGNCNACHEASGISYYNLPNLAVRPTAVDALHPAVGDGDCASCHALAFTSGAFNVPTVLPAVGHGPSIAHLPNPAGKSCVTCHTTVGAGESAAAAAASYAQYVMGASGHAGISNNCQSCHEGGSSFLNIGFSTTLVVRPYTPAVGVTPLDTNHPLKTAPNGADCVNCHSNSGFATGGFTNVATKPNNHIATTGAACSTCHSGGIYSAVVLPMPHTGAVSGTCASCHNNTTPYAGSVFTPAATGSGGTFGTQTGLNFIATQISSKISAGISTSGGHVALPSGDDCSTCHLSTSAFSGTAMVHTNITSGCASCHEAGDSFFGVASLAVRPTSVDAIHPQSSDGKDCSSCHSLAFGSGAFNIPTVLTAAGDGPTIAHLPNPAGRSCVTCHTSVSTGLSASAAATAYSQYVMGPAGHGGITADCEQCHERGSAFLNISQTGTALPLALMVRPNATAIGITVADAAHPLATQASPSGVDCVTCHSNTGFTAGGFNNVTTKPAGHIPVSGVACNTCHTGNGYTSVVLPMPHTGAVTGTCASCHQTSTLFAGSVFTPNAGVGASGGTFGTQTGLNFQPKQIVSSPAVGATGGHIPLPSGDDCSTCHLSTSAFGATAMVHTGITTGCDACHESNNVWYGVTNLAVRPTAIDSVHPATGDGDCSSCHSVAFTTGAFNIPTVLPAVGHGPTVAHIPNPAGKSCATCHTTVSTGISASAAFTAFTNYVMGPTGHGGIASDCEACHEGGSVFLNIAQTTTLMVRPSASAIGITPADAAHPLKTQVSPSGVDCITCHANSGFVAGGFNNVTTKPTGHIATTSVACSTCHTGTGYTSVVLPMPHTGAVSGTCASCHNNTTPYAGSVFTPAATGSGGTFGTTTGTNFIATQISSKISAGISTSGGHVALPSGDDCSTCHLSTSAFSGTAMVHTNITSGCASCHEAGDSFFGVASLAVRPSAVDPIHPASSDGKDCSSCHSAVFTTGAFNIPTVLPAAGDGASISHLPNPQGKSCVTCHTTVSAGLSAGAAYTAYTQYVMGTTGHAGITADCEQCHEGGSNFLNIGQTTTLIVRPSATAIGITPADAAHPLATQVSPSGVDCITCHTNTGFAAGGFNNVTTKPSNHIAVSGVACTTCHTTSGVYSSVVLPMPHTGAVTGTCASCHNSATVFAGSVFTPNTGVGASGGTFGTQSGTNFRAKQIVASPAVGATGGHIPLPSADDCSTCHLSTSTFGSTAMVHTNITSGCDSCHETSNVWYGVSNLAVRPTAIDSIHPVTGDGDCSTCHSVSFGSGAFNIPTVLPAVGHGPTTAHLPNPAGTGCVTCHTTLSAGLSASAAFTAFANYVMGPTGHTGITNTCQACHERGSVFLNISQTGTLMVRPNATAIGITIADAAHPAATATNGADCANCHSGTGFVAGGFSSGVTKPAGHINVASSATCNSCHTTGTTSVVLPMPHASVVGTCASCHNSTTLFAGSTFTPNVGTSGGTFGTQTSGLNFQARQIVSSPAVGTSGGHIPLPSGDDCSVCHTSTSAFGPGTAMVHTGISSGCATCHAAGSKWYGETYTASPLVTTNNVTLSPLHVPITGATNPACEECHSATVFTSFGTSTKVNHTSGAFMTYANGGSTDKKSTTATSTPRCVSCHAPSRTTWYGTSLSTETMGSHHNSVSTDDCIMCHNTGGFGGAAAAAARARRPVVRAAGPAVRPGPASVPAAGGTPASVPAVVAPFTHVGVIPGDCASCHAPGGTAPAKPASHLPTALSCDACHRTSAWLPALFTHNGVAAGSCATCHAGNWATAKPANHMLTSRACDTCHKSTTTWLPPAYAHLDMIYSPHPPSVRCVDCHATNTEQVVWKYPNLKPGCAGCHGTQFAAPAARRSKGPVTRPSTAQ